MKNIQEYSGKILYGFCNGYFGRESYGDKLIEEIGENWIVARNEKGYLEFAEFASTSKMIKCVKEWSKRPQY